MMNMEAAPKRATRIQRKNRRTILAAALDVFSARGFRGATIDQVAERAGMSKPNLLYYFPGKEAVYVAVLEDTLAEWLRPLEDLDPDGDPIGEIGRYMDAKLALSRNRPEASRLFASEILHGAPGIGPFLSGPLRALVDEKAAVIRGWIDAGRLAPVDPYHLIFMIWAVTQHYADFDVQVAAVLGDEAVGGRHFAAAARTARQIFLAGLAPASEAA